MKVWKDISDFSARNPVITIGIFDGVHKGHHFLLNEMKQKADHLKGETVVVTLWPHPRIVLNKSPDSLRYLTSIEEKVALMERSGVDHLVIIPFTREFSKLGSCEFIEEYLVKGLNVKKLIVGFNHKFGRNREGDYENLKECAKNYHFGLERLSPVEINGERISSSLIRKLLLEGQLELANYYLGYDFFIQGKIIEGNKIGRKIGFPTANIQPDDEHKLIPKTGVYAVQLEHEENMYKGMLNIGYRPTVNTEKENRSVEVHLFEFNREIYGSEVKLYFRKFMREEKKFDSLEHLQEQLVLDKGMSIDILRDLE